MSDSSSMMMVVLIGGVMCCGMACVGGMGVWYMTDPSLGGILGPAPSNSDSTIVPSDSTSTSTSDPPAASVPIDKAVYIWHKGCAAASTTNGARYTILAGNVVDTETGGYPVQLGCRSEPGANWGTKWRFQKANGKGETNLYYVRHEKSKKFLTAVLKSPDIGGFTLQDISTDPKIRWGQLWYIGKGSDGGVTLTLSKNALKKGGQAETWRYLAWNDQFCDGDVSQHKDKGRQANDPWFNINTSAKETLWGIRLPGDTGKMNNKCPTKKT